jgi:uncharacterized phage protein (TIGR02220 family)
MNIGWIKLHRQFKDWEWYNKSEMVHLFIHCLIKSNFKEGNFQGIEVEKGSFITSLKHLSDETNISIQTIRTCLKKLQLTKEIDVKSTNKLTKITICKYDSYQFESDEANKQLTNNQQTTNKQLTTIEERKENKEVKEDDKSSIDYIKLLDYINSTFNKNFKIINDKAKKQFKARLKDYSKDVFKIVIDNLKNDEYHKETNYKYITPEYISREKTIELHSQEIKIVTPDNLTPDVIYIMKQTGLTYEQLKG